MAVVEARLAVEAVRARVALLRVLVAARVVIRATIWIVTTWIVRAIRTVRSGIPLRIARRVAEEAQAVAVALQAAAVEALRPAVRVERTVHLRLPVEAREAVAARAARLVEDGTLRGLAIRKGTHVPVA